MNKPKVISLTIAIVFSALLYDLARKNQEIKRLEERNDSLLTDVIGATAEISGTGKQLDMAFETGVYYGAVQMREAMNYPTNLTYGRVAQMAMARHSNEVARLKLKQLK